MKDAGPLIPERLQELAEAPMGAAVKALREHDPLWGRAPGEKIKWRIRFTERVSMEGFVIIEAENEEEALKEFDAMPDDKLEADEWFNSDGIEFDSINPEII